MNPNHWKPVTERAHQADALPFEPVAFDLSDADREQAAKAQARLVTHRNEPMKRGTP